ncbi:MAG: hypothetical protein HKO81_05415 [Flavobacteriaceae bacterium]|nr:PLDc N-terminal domain-containing protein [Bacteroidia bacterium]NNL16063.1 hypothetical protein [Flavobacteriaceae bacterium]
MSSSNKVWLGILTFLPFVLFIVYLVLFFTLFLGSIHQLEQSHHDDFPIHFIRDIFIVFIPLITAIIISLILTIYYIVHANSNVKNDTAKKIMWTIILIFVSWVGCLVYYFVEILSSTKTNQVQVNESQ